MTTQAAPLSAEELALYDAWCARCLLPHHVHIENPWSDDDLSKTAKILTDIQPKLRATITQASADLAREKARGDEAQLTFLKHTAHVKLWMEQLAPYLGLDDDSATIKPIDIIEAAEKCRQFASDQATMISTLRSQLAEALKGQRTPGTNERCNACNGTDFVRGICEYSIDAKAGREPRPANCPIKSARTQEPTGQS